MVFTIPEFQGIVNGLSVAVKISYANCAFTFPMLAIIRN